MLRGLLPVLLLLSASRGLSTPLPENELHLEDRPFSLNGMMEDEFNAIIDRITNIYEPLVGLQGGQLIVKKSWINSQVNAFASQAGKNWFVTFYGGMARRPELTADGYSIVVCHEFGHHFAGFPFKTRDWYPAAEGQADYFATYSCARQLWKSDLKQNAEFRVTAAAPIKKACDQAWTAQADRDLCYRIITAGASFADLCASLARTTIDLAKKDTYVTPVTYYEHPDAQCRLDTMAAGALCTMEFDAEYIPGKANPRGINSASAELESAAYVCGKGSDSIGSPGFNGSVRPECWFKSHMSL